MKTSIAGLLTRLALAAVSVPVREATQHTYIDNTSKWPIRATTSYSFFEDSGFINRLIPAGTYHPKIQPSRPSGPCDSGDHELAHIASHIAAHNNNWRDSGRGLSLNPLNQVNANLLWLKQHLNGLAEHQSDIRISDPPRAQTYARQCSDCISTPNRKSGSSQN